MPEQLAPQSADDGLADRDDVVLVDERHLDVELGELRLPVGPEVLVAEAAHHLVVALHAGDHQQLLEQLRRLGQRVPVAGLQAHRHQEVTCTLRCRPGEVRRLDLQEALLVHDPADHLGGRCPQPQRPPRPLAAQVEVAVPQPGVLTDGDVLVDGKRQRVARAEDLDLGREHLDVPGRQLRVLVALRATGDLTDHLEAVLRAQLVGDGGVPDDHLHHAGRVAQVDEGDAPVVAAAGHPAGQHDLLLRVFGAQGAGFTGSDHCGDSSGSAGAGSGLVSMVTVGHQIDRRRVPAAGSAGTWSPERMSLTECPDSDAGGEPHVRNAASVGVPDLLAELRSRRRHLRADPTRPQRVGDLLGRRTLALVAHCDEHAGGDRPGRRQPATSRGAARAGGRPPARCRHRGR